MPLEFIDDEADAGVNVFLYGPPKSGKTMGAASAPGPILYVNTDRRNALVKAKAKYGAEKIREVKITNEDTLKTTAEITYAAQSGDYPTVVIDTVAELYRILLESLSGRAVSPSVPIRGNAGVYLERFIRGLIDLPINVVLIAHQLDTDADEGVLHLPFVTSKSGSPAFAAKIEAAVDVIGYTGAVQQEDESVKYMATLVERPDRRGGDRFGVLGPAREMDLTEWFSLAEGALTDTDQSDKD